MPTPVYAKVKNYNCTLFKSWQFCSTGRLYSELAKTEAKAFQGDRVDGHSMYVVTDQGQIYLRTDDELREQHAGDLAKSIRTGGPATDDFHR